jgi:hypothetical protein
MPLTINETPITDLGIGLHSLKGWRDGAAPTLDVAPIVGLLGGVQSERGAVAPRVIELTFRLRADTLEARSGLLSRLSDLLAGRAAYRFIDAPDRFVRGVASPLVVVGEIDDLALWHPALLASTRVTVADGVAYDIEPWGPLVGTAAARVPLPVGDAASPLVVELLGPMTGARTLTYRAANGSAVWAFEVSGTLTSDEVLRIDFGAKRIVRQSGTSSANAYAWKSPAAKWLRCSVDPRDADREAGQWPTLEVSAGTMRVLTRRTWRF